MYTPYQNQQQPYAQQRGQGQQYQPQQQQYQPQNQHQQYQPPQQQQSQQYGQPGLHHPQPQHYQQVPPQQQQQQGQPGQYSQDGPYGGFFTDPAASMAAQLAKNSFGQSNVYLQQNFGSFIPKADVNYYFKVSNSYVVRKVGLILFPYRHKNWTRLTASSTDHSVGTPSATPSQIQFAAPTHDINAPDLYIPLMAFITYILLWASFQGFKGDFHPEVFGYLASQTLACSIIDIVIFRVGLYLLNCSTQHSSFWDVIAFSGYKYVTIIALLCWKNLIGGGWIYYGVVFIFTASLSLFLMRSLKFLVLPSASGVDNPNINNISATQRRIRIQFLFLYAVVLQILLVLFMSR
ncbi:protein transport protein Yif1p [[Candida] anglica]|uniref:Protein YIF1 n=1 Tax=[Candida] anglica TaxID=148631 RepID=A0ABP0ECK2_9ASCO